MIEDLVEYPMDLTGVEDVLGYQIGDIIVSDPDTAVMIRRKSGGTIKLIK